MRILVTGGAGYIGSHTVKLLLAHGHDVTVYDNLSMGHREAVPAKCLVVGDLKDTDKLDQLLISRGIEAVIHFAASAYVGESVTHPAKYYTNNLLNSINLLELCRKNIVKRFVFSSTCATYGIPETVPIVESTPQTPINPYGQTKLAFEKMLIDYAAAYPIGVIALRYFNASGADPDGTLGEDHTPETHLIPLVLQVALKQRTHIDIFGSDYPTPDGTCVRDYIHVADLAEAHRLALDAIQPGTFRAYNVGVGNGASVRDVIMLAEAITGETIAVKYAPRRPGDPAVLVAAADAIRKDLGWAPKYPTLRPILESAWNWHRNHPRGFRRS
ncbi:UDP-glucose 4-epimerase GalE [soil metagenome]